MQDLKDRILAEMPVITPQMFDNGRNEFYNGLGFCQELEEHSLNIVLITVSK